MLKLVVQGPSINAVIDDFGLPGALQHLGPVFPGLDVVVRVDGSFPLELS
ncbi:MAG: hypothetical protein ACP5PJ_04205 [Acidimicrobiales bacterium]